MHERLFTSFFEMTGNDRQYDLVVFGASGFTGAFLIERLVESQYSAINWAVAGRDRANLIALLDRISARTGKNLQYTPIIIADSGNRDSLADMAKQAKVIVNTVGPYRLHGEAVVKAAIDNGACHVDVSGEPAYLESMELKYGKLAREKGVYIVGACGWDSIPADLGVSFVRRNFDGDLNSIRTFVEIQPGPDGYAINFGTYQTLILGICNAATDKLGQVRRELMPDKCPKSSFPLKKRFPLFKDDLLNSWCLPFMGSDKSVINRSMYFDFKQYEKRPFYVNTFIRMPSLFWSALLLIWMGLFSVLTMFASTRKLLQKFPDMFSFNLFKKSGPTRKQIEQTKFSYWFLANGWPDKKDDVNEQHMDKPEKNMVVRCDGPDPGYMSTAGCALSAALTILYDKDKLPYNGGVFTPSAAFGRDTDIYERLAHFGLTFNVVDNIQ